MPVAGTSVAADRRPSEVVDALNEFCEAVVAATQDRLQGATLDAGIGVAFGTVVAGNVGTTERYEYTVVGDPVNEAARITELVKKRDGRVPVRRHSIRRVIRGRGRRRGPRTPG
jgi:adenylate cyclase